jgi:hypothetical protein
MEAKLLPYLKKKSSKILKFFKRIIIYKVKDISYLNYRAPANLASGVYFYKLTANGFSDTKKMILVK